MFMDIGMIEDIKMERTQTSKFLTVIGSVLFGLSILSAIILFIAVAKISLLQAILYSLLTIFGGAISLALFLAIGDKLDYDYYQCIQQKKMRESLEILAKAGTINLTKQVNDAAPSVKVNSAHNASYSAPQNSGTPETASDGRAADGPIMPNSFVAPINTNPQKTCPNCKQSIPTSSERCPYCGSLVINKNNL